MFLISLPLTSILFALAGIVSGLGTSCTAPLGAGTSGKNDPFWMQNIKHQGTAPLNSNPSSYTVFRNVKVKYKPLIIDPLHQIFFTGLWSCWRWSERWYIRHQVKNYYIFWSIFLHVCILTPRFSSAAISSQNRCGGGGCPSTTSGTLPSFFVEYGLKISLLGPHRPLYSSPKGAFLTTINTVSADLRLG